MESERMHPSVVLYDYAMRMVGLPYRWGGDDLVDGVDCSGGVIELLQVAGVLPRIFDSNAAGLFHFPAFSKCDAPRFGTLVFYGKPEAVSHVAFCLNETQAWEAGGGGSKTKTREDAAAQNAYVRVRTIKSRADLVGYRQPNYPWKV